MGGMFGSNTISTSDKRINSMRIQQSAYGLCQPLVYGKNRVAANMFWYGDFTSTAHTTTTKAGGKGGGAKTKNTTYTYSTSLMLGLCENKIKAIGTVWRDKEQIFAKQERIRIGGTSQNPIYEYRTVSSISQLGFELFNDSLEDHLRNEFLHMRNFLTLHGRCMGILREQNADVAGQHVDLHHLRFQLSKAALVLFVIFHRDSLTVSERSIPDLLLSLQKKHHIDIFSVRLKNAFFFGIGIIFDGININVVSVHLMTSLHKTLFLQF